ncbi:hypothetical protein BDV95DRAFT_580854 [Massariosphaeria phaeospora]|uniref:Uncharacterized protein n=1 Tax=Massariosphaeria phaeospora TaxID=100035 RepID=A0A7C8I5P6_9PLEO|nr:hypothetical protein BDV95DRAFT_580854 [Massariosphaeria phaeospora]
MKIIQRFMAQYKHSQDSTQAVGNSWRQDFTSVFLGHARLYAFAGQYLIDSLQALALRNIHKALSTYTLFARSVGSINQLAYFAYNNNCIPDRAYGKIDPLRLMVVEFIALRFKYFELDDGHKELMEVEGQYATDLLAALAESYGS